jgi:hypothetical protein
MQLSRQGSFQSLFANGGLVALGKTSNEARPTGTEGFSRSVSKVASRLLCKFKRPLTPVLIEVVKHGKDNSFKALRMPVILAGGVDYCCARSMQQIAFITKPVRCS